MWATDRLMLLDHLTHGRIIGGVGPGSLPEHMTKKYEADKGG